MGDLPEQFNLDKCRIIKLRTPSNTYDDPRFDPVATGVGLGPGYVQKGELREWLKTINGWIRELEGTFAFEEKWSLDEQLSNFAEDTTTHMALCASQHPRGAGAISKSIRIRHLWVKMKRQ